MDQNRGLTDDLRQNSTSSTPDRFVVDHESETQGQTREIVRDSRGRAIIIMLCKDYISVASRFTSSYLKMNADSSNGSRYLKSYLCSPVAGSALIEG